MVYRLRMAEKQRPGLSSFTCLTVEVPDWPLCFRLPLYTMSSHTSFFSNLLTLSRPCPGHRDFLLPAVSWLSPSVWLPRQLL